jgi:proteasome accessory factor B
MKLSRISRIVRLLTTLQSGHAYPPDELAKLLCVSRRTVFRDLGELAAIGVPYHFDSEVGGYKIDPTFFLPPIDLNLHKALSLLLLVHKGREHLPVPFKNSALLGGLKIESNLPEDIRNYCNATLVNVSIRPDSYAPTDSLDRFFAQLQESIRKRQKVKIEYHSLYEGRDISVTLCPLHLMYNSRAWYVIGVSSLHKMVRTFKLNRIKSLTALKNRFLRDSRFDIQEYLGGAWSMIPEGRLYNVRLRFSPKVAKNVAEVHWHRSQQAAFEGDGSLIVEFRVNGLGEIGWWILGYGDQVEVLRPAALRKRIRSTAERMLKINATT